MVQHLVNNSYDGYMRKRLLHSSMVHVDLAKGENNCFKQLLFIYLFIYSFIHLLIHHNCTITFPII